MTSTVIEAPAAEPAVDTAGALVEPPAGPVTVQLALISHTNAGKTTLARTLLGRDVGEVRDAPHVTEIAQVHGLLASAEGDVLQLWDTPGFGDSARLVARLRHADNPIGWILREVWDRHRDRPLWCSQQAVRAARESADVVLYLANAAEDPRDAGYVAPEMQVLRWIGKPVIVLLNQVGAPRGAAEEEAELERWRSHVGQFGPVGDVLAMDAFARCWVQERVLLDAVGRLLPAPLAAGYTRLVARWQTLAAERFEASMAVLAEQLVAAARDHEPLELASDGALQRLLRAVGIGRKAVDVAREHAMGALAERLDRAIGQGTERLIGLHGLDGVAARTVLEQMAENFAVRAPVDEGRTALWSSVVSGALAGLKADLAAGGLTFGAGMVVGGLIGGLAGAGVARGINVMRGDDYAQVRWSDLFLDGLARSTLLRYLAVAHFGRGRGRYIEGEAPAVWRGEAEQALAGRAAELQHLWDVARNAAAADLAPVHDELSRLLGAAAVDLLGRLYPGAATDKVLAGLSRAGAG
jgi:hypothetical protein